MITFGIVAIAANDLVTRQLIHYIKVVSKEKLQIYFKDGTIIDADI